MTRADFFLVNRSLQKLDLWLSETFTRGQAWVDLIGLTNYKDGYLRKNGKRVDLKRGQCGWSQAALAVRWKWSRGKVKRFFDELETEQQIEQLNSTICSITIIVNYDEYQLNGQGMEQLTGSSQTGDGQVTDTNKEVKEVKEVKEKELKPLGPTRPVFGYKPFFEIFWDHYPRRDGQRRGRKKTENQYRAIVTNEATAGAVLTAVGHYADSCGNYAKDAERWMRKGVWDEWLNPDIEVNNEEDQRLADKFSLITDAELKMLKGSQTVRNRMDFSLDEVLTIIAQRARRNG